MYTYILINKTNNIVLQEMASVNGKLVPSPPHTRAEWINRNWLYSSVTYAFHKYLASSSAQVFFAAAQTCKVSTATQKQL